MRLSSQSPLALATTLLYGASIVAAQTSTDCNPLDSTSCEADTALGTSVSIDFSSESSEFTFGDSGTITYSSTNGAAFTIKESGDAPTLTSNWYIMFGYAEFKMKIASGTGIVSCAVFLSDDLDEIDFEWIGGEASEVQTNYFGKGDTTDTNRGATIATEDGQDQFMTYSVDWTSERIIWAVNGEAIRTLTAADADTDQYPQTPMRIKIGIWAGGDSSNAAGTIAWAGGATDYSDGPFTMYCKSAYIQDYSTGSSYKYTDTSGDWTSIEAVDGEVYSGAGSTATASAASSTITSSSDAPAYGGTHKSSSTRKSQSTRSQSASVSASHSAGSSSKASAGSSVATGSSAFATTTVSTSTSDAASSSTTASGTSAAEANSILGQSTNAAAGARLGENSRLLGLYSFGLAVLGIYVLFL